jgi:hypothetical protein
MVANPLAILVSDQEAVNLITAKMIERGVKPLFSPEEHSQFASGYYAATFCDS